MTAEQIKAQPDVAYTPWLDIENQIVVGPVTFSSWRHIKANMADGHEKRFLDWLFKKHVDLLGQPVGSVAIGHTQRGLLEVLTDEELDQAQNAVTALAFVTIFSSTLHAVGKNNQSHSPPSSDRFKLSFHKVLPDRVMVIRNGGQTQMWTDDYPFSIARPPHVVSGLFPKLDAGLLGAIGDAMTSNQISDALRHRLFRALDWFRLANTNSDDVPWRTKVVMMATAFGTLLDIQGQRKAAEIADFLDKCSPPNAIKQKIKDSKGKEIERTIQGLWGRKFYRVRNQITHGDQVTAQTVHFMHGRAGSWLNDLIVANIVFGQCVGDILHQQGMLPHPLNLSDIYRDFGWVR